MAETIYNDRIDRVVYRSTGAVSDDDFWSLAWYYPALVQSPTLAAGISYQFLSAPYQPGRDMPTDLQFMLDNPPAPVNPLPFEHLLLATNDGRYLASNEGVDIAVYAQEGQGRDSSAFPYQ